MITIILIIIILIINTLYLLININLFNNTDEIMSTRLEKYDIYDIDKLTGLALKCDRFLHGSNIINITNTDKPKIFFLSNYCGNITIPYFVNNILPNINWTIKVIIASEDFTFPKGDKDFRTNFYHDKQDIVYNLINNKYVKYIFVENLDTLHPKLIPIPLGILNYDKYEYDINMSIKNIDIRDIRVFCCHRNRDGPQWENRKKVKNLCLTSWKDLTYYIEDLNNHDFKETLLNSQFVLCVNGGGIDPSPRVWQALLCGCIPIMQNSTLNEAYNRFPIVFIDEWNENTITNDKLNEWFNKYKIYNIDNMKRKEVLNMLTLNYWWDIIKNK